MKKLLLLVLCLVLIGCSRTITIHNDNSNPFYNNLTIYRLIRVYHPRGDDRKVHLAKEVADSEKLEIIKDIFLGAEIFNDSLTDCLPYYVLAIFDQNNENSYLTDLWMCRDLSSNIVNYPYAVIVFRETGTTPGQERENATGLKFPKEESRIIFDIIELKVES